MEFPFEGIPTVPPRKDVAHLTFFCAGCRYRVTADPSWTVSKAKEALWAGGIARSNRTEGPRATPGLSGPADLELMYAGRRMADGAATLASYHVPPGCQCLIAVEKAKLDSGLPDPSSAYWN